MSRDRYLEDFLPQLSYRPSGIKVNKKLKEEPGVEKDLADAGVDEECQAAIRTIMRSEDFDYEVSEHHLFTIE